jgi:uncharacterized protein YyaL (SSP411 family)
MKIGRIFLLFYAISALLGGAALGENTRDPIAWQSWSDDLFEQARQEKKLVILDLEAVWCHWCHVMADTTYHDPKVVKLINSKFIPVRVDQDAHPDLSLRYEKWGWPATVVFTSDGEEIIKERGYIEPPQMAKLLEDIIKNPAPGKSEPEEPEIQISKNAFLSEAQKQILLKEHSEDLYDSEFGGWGFRHKLLDLEHCEYAMMRAREGDLTEEVMAKKTLDQALYLLDSEWGGFYQYSDQRDWKSPHFEKIMLIQAQYIRLYALAYALWQNEMYLKAAQKTGEYVFNFWTSPEGAFYTSQDADIDEKLTGHQFYVLKSAERKKLGRAPKIDRHIYARENGWMILSLAVLYEFTGEQSSLSHAVQAAEWILKNRSLPSGGFRHDEKDRAGPYLGDSLAMGQAFLELYVATADRKWILLSEKAAGFIDENFRDQKGGFITARLHSKASGAFRQPIKQMDENFNLARWTNNLFHYTGKKEYKAMAEHALKYVVSTSVFQSRSFRAGLLLADREMAQDPLHITIVGSKKDKEAENLFLSAISYPAVYRRVEWWDKKEGALPNPDVTYPQLEKAAAFLCADNFCSLPFFSPDKLRKALEERKNTTLKKNIK